MIGFKEAFRLRWYNTRITKEICFTMVVYVS